MAPKNMNQYHDGVYGAGELVLVNLLNGIENRGTHGKVRPAALVRRDGGQWKAMGLTTLSRYGDGTPRTPVPNPTAVGLRGPGYLWGCNLVSISVIDIGRHIGWADAALAEAIIALAKLTEPDAGALRRAAKEHREEPPGSAA